MLTTGLVEVASERQKPGTLQDRGPGNGAGLVGNRLVPPRTVKRSLRAYRSCLELSLLTPVLAEAFINLVILALCKKEIRDNSPQLDAFIRSPIDTKLFDLAYKCDGFLHPINRDAESFKNFKRVMDKRNNTIHGNCDPEKEQIELVYFQGNRPLFKEPGDNIGKWLQALERQYQPRAVIQDYEHVHIFLYQIIDYLHPGLVQEFRRVVEDPYPGYDMLRKKMGSVLPRHIIVGHAEGVRYDDELQVVWTPSHGDKDGRRV